MTSRSRRSKIERWWLLYMCIFLAKMFLERYEKSGRKNTQLLILRQYFGMWKRILRLSIYTPIKVFGMCITECDTNP
jgi:hypothetical protein